MPYCDKILEASEPFIDQIVKREDLKEKRFLITGATGMIGSSVLDLLLFLNERKQYGITIYAAVRNDSKIKKDTEYLLKKSISISFLMMLRNPLILNILLIMSSMQQVMPILLPSQKSR